MAWWVKKQKYQEARSRWTEDRERNQKFYQSKQWQKLRLLKLSEEPLCEHCLAKNIVTAGEEVDHIISITIDWSKRLSYDNLQVFCKSCHSKKTAKDKLQKDIQKSMNELSDFD